MKVDRVSSGRATATCCANIAFVKYWGILDAEATLPYNESVSMNLDRCTTTTTVHFDSRLNTDEVEIAWYGLEPEPATGSALQRVVAQLDRIRAAAGSELRARVESANTFPADAGIASSASGFAALTAAGAAAAGLVLSERELSVLTRRSGSGSACRSIPTGFVQWRNDGSDEGSYGVSIARPDAWALADVIAIVDAGPKRVSSADNHRLAASSPYFPTRLQELPGRVEQCVLAVRTRDLGLLGRVSEEDAVSLHVVAMTASPPTFYWQAGTLAVMQAVHAWRNEGLFSYWTMDAGANVHVLCEMNDAAEVARRLEALPQVHFTIRNGPGEGAVIHGGG
ncbi:MAG: diphosphomevalonate decarboxylase [Herpetosiphon sp.]